MKINRRKFLTALGIGLGAKSLKSQSNRIDLQELMFSPGESDKLINSGKILSPGLKQGSVIAITAPASPANLGEIASGVKALKKIGFSVVIGDTVKNFSGKYRYFSASDKDRANEFMKFAEDCDIDAILCARGGYGIMRILPFLDYGVIRENPKPIIGFSDITALINAIYKISKLVTFHGPVAAMSFNSFTVANFQKILFPAKIFKPIEFLFNEIKVINQGLCSGVLCGGNLTMLTSTLGTPYEIDSKNSILLIEEVSEQAYKIDRMLTQLWLAGKLQNSKGIIFGNFKNIDKRSPFFPNKGYTVREVIEQIIKPLNIPSIIGMPIGHDSNILTIPIGTLAELDTKKKKLTLLEPSVL